MAYPKEFLKIDWIFTLAGTAEVADTGVKVSTLGGAAFNSAAALAAVTTANINSLFTAWITLGSGVNMWADFSRLTSVKVAAVDVAGHYVASPKIVGYTSGNAGTKTGNKAQDSEVLTLWSGLTFGRANYGRMYLPHCALPNTAGGPYSTAATQANLSVFGAAFIDSVNTLANTWVSGAGVVNLSKVDAGTVKAVATVRAGRVTDTQRRRRNRLTEQYIDTAV